jgi:hypothetical protein
MEQQVCMVIEHGRARAVGGNCRRPLPAATGRVSTLTDSGCRPEALDSTEVDPAAVQRRRRVSEAKRP